MPGTYVDQRASSVDSGAAVDCSSQSFIKAVLCATILVIYSIFTSVFMTKVKELTGSNEMIQFNGGVIFSSIEVGLLWKISWCFLFGAGVDLLSLSFMLLLQALLWIGVSLCALEVGLPTAFFMFCLRTCLSSSSWLIMLNGIRRFCNERRIAFYVSVYYVLALLVQVLLKSQQPSDKEDQHSPFYPLFSVWLFLSNWIQRLSVTMSATASCPALIACLLVVACLRPSQNCAVKNRVSPSLLSASEAVFANSSLCFPMLLCLAFYDELSGQPFSLAGVNVPVSLFVCFVLGVIYWMRFDIRNCSSLAFVSCALLFVAMGFQSSWDQCKSLVLGAIFLYTFIYMVSMSSILVMSRWSGALLAVNYSARFAINYYLDSIRRGGDIGQFWVSRQIVHFGALLNLCSGREKESMFLVSVVGTFVCIICVFIINVRKLIS